MKAAFGAVLWFVIGGGAAGEEASPRENPIVTRGWARDEHGIWRAVPADGSYHVAYNRRGCRVEENWDGAQYTALVKCAPGVRPR